MHSSQEDILGVLRRDCTINFFKAGSTTSSHINHYLDPTVLDNFCPFSILTFLGKVVVRVVGTQLQRALDKAGYLDPFQAMTLH